jgi:hypothetical protein
MINGQAPLSYILVDYENVLPDDFDLVPESSWRLMVFLGAAQRPRIAFLKVKLRLGESCSYVRVQKRAKNAVDFHIAYYLGVLTDIHPGDSFYVISNDHGYDPLLDYLNKKKGIKASRVERISSIKALRAMAVLSSRKITWETEGAAYLGRGWNAVPTV